jgi:Ca-activated chloride channel homolog
MRHSVVRAAFIVNRLETRIRRGDPGTSRTGGVVILFVLLLPVLLAMVAFAVDVGRVTMLRSELQNVVDSGTLAAQIQLRTKPNAVGKAKKVAIEYVRRNMIGSRLVPKGSIDVEVGYWDSETSTFDTSNPVKNAVRVFARQDDQPYIFGRTMGYQTFGVPASAIATGATSTLDIMLTLDLSGSMLYQGRIQALRASAPVFVDVIDELGNSDQIGVMGLSADPSNFDLDRVGPNATLYNSGLHATANHHVGVMEHPLTSNLSSVTSETLTNTNLRASKYHGATGTGAALGDSVHYLTNGAEARSHASKIVVLMTDGHANRPSGNGPGYARQMATYAAANGVTVYTISLGNAADEVLNQDIADTTGGKHFLARGQDVTLLTQSLTNAFKDIVDDIKSTHLVK